MNNFINNFDFFIFKSKNKFFSNSYFLIDVLFKKFNIFIIFSILKKCLFIKKSFYYYYFSRSIINKLIIDISFILSFKRFIN